MKLKVVTLDVPRWLLELVLFVWALVNAFVLLIMLIVVAATSTQELATDPADVSLVGPSLFIVQLMLCLVALMFHLSKTRDRS